MAHDKMTENNRLMRILSNDQKETHSSREKLLMTKFFPQGQN